MLRTPLGYGAWTVICFAWQFKVDEYDGSESVETRDGTDWVIA